MGRLRYALWPAGLAFGLAAERIGKPELILLDAAAGFALLFLGLVASSRRRGLRAGAIMAVAGFTWFLGTLWGPAVFLHRGVLAHLLLSYPSGKLSSSVERMAVGTAYAYAVAYPIADSNYATVAFAVGLFAVSLRRYAVVGGPDRRERLAPLIAATAFGLILTMEAAARLASVGHDRAALFAYDLTVFLIAVGLFADLRWGRWAQRAVTGLVVDLGSDVGVGSLRDRLARTLGDPTLLVAYRVPDGDGYTDEAGRHVELPSADPKRAVTPIDADGRRVAVIVHDASVLADPQLVAAVSSATRLALSNARLQAQVVERVAEVEASRRRIVEASDEQRQRLERDLREGAERRLIRVARLLTDSGEPLAEVRDGLDAARAELRDFARGIHPATLTERGLHEAIQELAERSPIPVRLTVPATRFSPAVEAAAYFVCSESLTNVAKYSGASRVDIAVAQQDGWMTIVIVDNGVGGADPSGGFGLRGLADRIEALGGRIRIDSPPGAGTQVRAEFPLKHPAVL
jgi:signal transduction histidine kinase